jgi:hypothetical protein
MKPQAALTLGVAMLIGASALARPAAAQTPARLAHGDVSTSLGWLRVDGRGDADWSNRHLSKGIELGWYWTEHLKTTVDTGPRIRSRAYTYEPIVIGGQPFSGFSTYDSRQHRISVTQHYQFGHNQWVHPFIAGGVQIVRDRTMEVEGQITTYDPVTRQTRVLRESITHPEVRDIRTRALFAFGAKTYLHRRVFMLSDARFVFGRRLESHNLRIGLGVDF